MLNVSITVDDKKVQAAFRRAPDVMRRTLDRYLTRAATEMVRAEQDEVQANGSIMRSFLVSSFFHQTPSPFVREVKSAMHYAKYVNDGSRPGGAPPMFEAMEWLRIRKGVPKEQLHNRAYWLRKKIAEKGIKPTHFNEKAFAKKESRLTTLVREGVDMGIRSAFGS